MKKILTQTVAAFFLSCLAMKSNSQWQLTGNANATATSVLGTTNSIPLNLVTNNLQRMTITSAGRVGIGTTTPPNIFTVKGAGSTPAASWVSAGAPLFVGYGETAVGNADYILSMASTSNNGRPVFVGRRSRGSLAVPTIMANNDFIMSMLASGYDGTTFQNPATIDFFVDGTPSAGNVPARISFVTGSNSTNRAERLKVGSTGDIAFNSNQLFVEQSTGNVSIGSINPTAKLEVVGQIKITGGSPGEGKVLTSNAAGLAKWSSNGLLPTGLGGQTLRNNSLAWVPSSMIMNTGLQVGIGETNPQGVLHVSQPFNFSGVSFTGTGLDDLTADVSGFNGSGTASYVIRIQNAGPNPNIIEISNDGGVTFGAPVPINNPIVLANGVSATFAALTGHTFADQWAWNIGIAYKDMLVAKDGKVGIGTATPSALLDINGVTKAKSFVATDTSMFGQIGVAGPTQGGFAINLNAKSSVAGINVTDPVSNYVLYCGNKSGASSAVYLVKSSRNTSTAVVLGYASGSGGGIEGGAHLGIGTYGASDSSFGVYGYTGISSTYAGYFNGNVFASGIYSASDSRLKKNIRDFDGGLEMINKLHPKSYTFRTDGWYGKMNLPTGTHIGIMAQELEKVLPEAVKESSINTNYLSRERGNGKEQGPGENIDFKAVNYVELIPVMIKGMQELSAKNEELTAANDKLVKQNADQQTLNQSLETRLSKLEGMMNTGKQQNVSLSSASLEQNIPNPPVNNATKINYNIPASAANAEMTITDVYGKKVKQINLNKSGKGILNVDTKGLAAGTFSYTLFVDGKMIETKKMVVAGN